VLGTLQASAASKPVPAPKSNLAELKVERRNLRAPQCATMRHNAPREKREKREKPHKIVGRRMQKAYHEERLAFKCFQLATKLQDFAFWPGSKI
jgi:hypothetical protein